MICYQTGVQPHNPLLQTIQDPCVDPEGGTPEKSQNIGFLSNTGQDPLKNHKATKPAFNVGHHRPAS